jgi:hypothetical protein
VVPILVISSNGMRPADNDDELMLKWFSGALALSLIAAFAWEHRDFRSIECNQWLDGECIPRDCSVRTMAPGVNPMLPMEKPNKGLEAVARALRRFLFAILILLGLAFAVVGYAELLGVVQFD